MGWMTEDGTHEGFLVAYRWDGWELQCPPASLPEHQRATFYDDARRAYVALVAVGCDCGWRSARVPALGVVDYQPWRAAAPDAVEEVGRELFYRHVAAADCSDVSELARSVVAEHEAAINRALGRACDVVQRAAELGDGVLHANALAAVRSLGDTIDAAELHEIARGLGETVGIAPRCTHPNAVAAIHMPPGTRTCPDCGALFQRRARSS